MMKKNVPVTLLTCPASTLKYVDSVSKELGLSRVGFARGVLAGLSAAKASFPGVRNADELGDAVRKLATAPATEVQSNG
jgi:hypothetical protein